MDADGDEAEILAWWAAVARPAAPYRLGPELAVDDPATSHAWLDAAIARGQGGQVRRWLLARLRRLRDTDFGGRP